MLVFGGSGIPQQNFRNDTREESVIKLSLETAHQGGSGIAKQFLYY
jgi:hypothetical protein